MVVNLFTFLLSNLLSNTFLKKFVIISEKSWVIIQRYIQLVTLSVNGIEKVFF